MELLLLSGNSLRNRDWILEIKQQLSEQFPKSYIQNYQHWETGEEWIDLRHELEALSKTVADKTDYAVFAKSIGTVLAVQAIEQGFLKPKFLLFTGIPLDYIKQHYLAFAQLLAEYDRPITIIHNDHDKVGTAADVQTYLAPLLANKPDYQFIATPGNTHDYEDYDLLRKELQKLLDEV